MSTYPILWEHDEPITSYEHDDYSTPEVPDWVDQDISPSQVAAIVQGGCDSGAYMPAVTYHQALATMAEYGDEIFEYLENDGYEPVELLMDASSWAGMACALVSTAVECWAASIERDLGELLGAIEDDQVEADDEEDEDEEDEADEVL